MAREKPIVAKDRDREEQSRKPYERPYEPQESPFNRTLPVIVIVYLVARVIRVGVSLFFEVVSHGG
jgi:hypothetical protein